MLRLPESQMESERRVQVLQLPEPGIITVQPRRSNMVTCHIQHVLNIVTAVKTWLNHVAWNITKFISTRLHSGQPHEAVALLLPSNAIRVKVGLKCYDCLDKGLLQPRISTPFTYYIISVLHYITGVETLHMMCTVWISYEDKFYQRIYTLVPYSIQPIFQSYWVSVSEVGLGILIWKSVPGNRESGLLWGSCLVWTLVLCCCHICAVLMDGLVCVSEHMSLNIRRGWGKNLRKHMNQSIK